MAVHYSWTTPRSHLTTEHAAGHDMLILYIYNLDAAKYLTASTLPSHNSCTGGQHDTAMPTFASY